MNEEKITTESDIMKTVESFVKKLTKIHYSNPSDCHLANKTQTLL